jgi:hypothetical protein
MNIDYQDCLHYCSSYVDTHQRMDASMHELRAWRRANPDVRLINIETLFEAEQPSQMRGLRIWFEKE